MKRLMFHTRFFVDKVSAISYYAEHGIDTIGVEYKLEIGEIHIGEPVLPKVLKNRRDVKITITEEGRYVYSCTP